MDSDLVLTNNNTNYSQNTSLTNSLFGKGNDGLFWLRFYMLCLVCINNWLDKLIVTMNSVGTWIIFMTWIL